MAALTPVPVAPEPEPLLHGGWPVSEIPQLFNTVTASFPTVRKLFDMTTAKSGKPYTFEQARKEARLTFGKSRAEMGAFSKVLKSRFGDRGWPLHWGQEGGRPGLYKADGRFAAAWIAAREAASEQDTPEQ
jgi:hypothetical protein